MTKPYHEEPTLVERIRFEARMASRAGQFRKLEALADEVAEVVAERDELAYGWYQANELAETWQRDHDRHLKFTRLSAPNHRPCESGARAKAGRALRDALDTQRSPPPARTPDLEQLRATIEEVRSLAADWEALADWVNIGTDEQRARSRAGLVAAQQLRDVLPEEGSE